MAASRRSPNLSGKPNLRWTALGPRVGEDPTNTKYSFGSQMGQAPGDTWRYFIIRAVVGDEWHAVRERYGESETIGSGTYSDAYHYCKNLHHWGEVSPLPRDRRHSA
jgi:hypothetical protein